MSLVLEERITGIWQSSVTDDYKNCASWDDSCLQNGGFFDNTPLFWRDENSKDAYLGSDFVLIEITDPKLYE